MGASGWDYIEPFDTDLATTLANLRRRVFDEGDYFWFDSIPKPATFAELEGLFAEIAALTPDEIDYEDPRIIQLADIASSGTHSILDMSAVGARPHHTPARRRGRSLVQHRPAHACRLRPGRRGSVGRSRGPMERRLRPAPR